MSDVSEPIHLAADLPLDAAQYDAIARDLAELLNPALGAIDRRLVAQSVYLQLLARFLRQARTVNGTLAAGSDANTQPLAVFRQRIHLAVTSATRGAAQISPTSPYTMVLNLADKGRSSPILRRLFLGFMQSLRNEYTIIRWPRGGLLADLRPLAAAYLRFATGHGVVAPPGHAPLPHARVSDIRFDPDRPELDTMLTTHFRNALSANELLLQDTILFAHQLQLMQWGMIHWIGAALAAETGAGSIGPTHLGESLRLVNEHYGPGSPLTEILRARPRLRAMTDRLCSNRAYTFSLGKIC